MKDLGRQHHIYLAYWALRGILVLFLQQGAVRRACWHLAVGHPKARQSFGHFVEAAGQAVADRKKLICQQLVELIQCQLAEIVAAAKVLKYQNCCCHRHTALVTIKEGPCAHRKCECLI